VKQRAASTVANIRFFLVAADVGCFGHGYCILIVMSFVSCLATLVLLLLATGRGRSVPMARSPRLAFWRLLPPSRQCLRTALSWFMSVPVARLLPCLSRPALIVRLGARGADADMGLVL
jgi:hypothetical protein